jgi:hypothetical protein
MIDPAFPTAFRDALQGVWGRWRTDGDAVRGPGGAAVHFAHRHESLSPGHVDVEFRWGGARSLWPPFRRAPHVSLWDCVAGLGESSEERARFAAKVWTGSTGAACVEMLSGHRGWFAEHSYAGDPNGFSGWHVIHAPLVAYGKGDAAEVLQGWCMDNPILPHLVPALADTVPAEAGPHGLKILLGAQDVAEVRLDGEHHDAGSAALLALPWPRLDLPGFVRTYAVLLHREH